MKLPWWVFVAGVVAGFVGIRLHDAALLRQAALRASTDSARIATQALEDSLPVLAYRDSIRADSLLKMGAIVTKLGTRVKQLMTRADSLLTASALLGQKSPDSSTVRQVIAVKDSVISAQAGQIMTLTEALALSERRVAQKDSAITALNHALQRQLQLTAAWQKAAQPSLLKRVETAAPWLAGAFLLGRALR